MWLPYAHITVNTLQPHEQYFWATPLATQSQSFVGTRQHQHVMWVDSSVCFPVHEGRSFDSDLSDMPSRLRRIYVPAGGIFYLPKQFDLVSVIPQVYDGFDLWISSNHFLSSFISPGITKHQFLFSVHLIFPLILRFYWFQFLDNADFHNPRCRSCREDLQIQYDEASRSRAVGFNAPLTPRMS